MTHIMSHGSHTCDLVEHITCFMSFEMVKVYCALTHMSQLIDFILLLIMSCKSYVIEDDESLGLGVWEDCL